MSDKLLVEQKTLTLSLRSRLTLVAMKLIGKPLLSRMMRASLDGIAKYQIATASLRWPSVSGITINYDIVGNSPGHVFGDLSDNQKPIMLWFHGGAFILPAAANVHLGTAAKLCSELGAVGFMPDYRLAPSSPFPAALDDCERAYLDLLEQGFAASKIVIIGDSAGGNLLFGVLQRLRQQGIAMPACALPLSPVTELSRLHGLPSRSRLRKKDPLLPLAAFVKLVASYFPGRDAIDPEISPLYMNCSDLPPLLFIVSSNEVLMDDSVSPALPRCGGADPVSCLATSAPRVPAICQHFSRSKTVPRGDDSFYGAASQHWAANSRRSSRLRIFPAPDSGNGVCRKLTERGRLKSASAARQWSIICCSLSSTPSRATTTA